MLKCLGLMAFVGPPSPVAALAQLPPPGAGPVLLIVAPGTDRDAVSRALDAPRFGPSSAPQAFLVAPDGPDDASGLALRAGAHGVWEGFDGAAVVQLCGA